MPTPHSRRASPVELIDELAEGHPEPYHHLRRDVLEILDAAVQAVQPDRLLPDAVSEEGVLEIDDARYELGRGEDVHVLVAGDGSPGFAAAAHELLPEARGLVIAVEEGEVADWPWFVGDHPIPDKASLQAGRAAMEFAGSVPEDETLLVLLTGGASALMEVPSIPLEDMALTTRTLLARGLTIHEMNMVRKHLSELKGGGLAQACPGRVITLAISDVPHDRPSDLGSGPTVPDPTTFSQTWAVLDRVGTDNFPPVVVDHVRRGVKGEVDETPKPGDALEDVRFHLLATNEHALAAAEERARQLGHRPKVLPSPLDGEARVVGESLGKRLVSEGRALLAGGETTVSLKPEHEGGPGVGGRNQELTLAASMHIEDAPAVVCGFGTDGIDGPTDAAGALADGHTLGRGMEAKRDPEQHLEDNDAYAFFASLGDLIRTGPTGTNVMDLFVGLIEPED